MVKSCAAAVMNYEPLQEKGYEGVNVNCNAILDHGPDYRFPDPSRFSGRLSGLSVPLGPGSRVQGPGSWA